MLITDFLNILFNKFKRLRSMNYENFRNCVVKLYVFFVLFACFTFFATNAELLEVDEVAHYSLNRSIPSNPRFLINPWGKPLFSIISFLVILATNDVGLISIRPMNVLISMTTCFITYKLCKKLESSEFWAFSSIFLVAFSHLFLKISFSALTEPLFTLLLILSIYFFYFEKFSFSAFFISLSCIARQEGFLLLPVWWLFLFKSRRALLITMIFPTSWAVLLWLNAYSPLYMITMYSEVVNPLVANWEGQNITGKGFSSFLYYPSNVITILGTLTFILFLIGFVYNWKNKTYALLYLTIISYLFFHSIILVFPYFGSVAFLRYLYPIIPLMAIFSTSGLRKLSSFFYLVGQKITKAKLSKNLQKMIASIILLILSLNCLLVVTPKSENQKILDMAPPLYNVVQHEVGKFLVGSYPKDVGVFCPTNLFTLQLYLSIPILYFPKEDPSERNYTVMKLDGDFRLYSFDICADCPPGYLVIWTNDLMYWGSEFHPHRINDTIYKTVFEMSRGAHAIIVYERM